MNVTNHPVEIEGKTYVVQKRHVDEGDDVFRVEYSFDHGETWCEALIDAYRSAFEQGRLVSIGEPITEGGEFEAFLLALVAEITALAPGEQVKIIRTDTQVVVVKEQGVLAVKASTIRDVDLQMKEDNRG